MSVSVEIDVSERVHRLFSIALSAGVEETIQCGKREKERKRQREEIVKK